MSAPTELSLQAVKRLGRYLCGRGRMVYDYPWQEAKGVDVYSDTGGEAPHQVLVIHSVLCHFEQCGG